MLLTFMSTHRQELDYSQQNGDIGLGALFSLPPSPPTTTMSLLPVPPEAVGGAVTVAWDGLASEGF